MPTLGKAYVQIVPSAVGIKGSISKALQPEADAAGKAAGAKASKGIGEKLGTIGPVATKVGSTLTKGLTVPIVGVGAAAVNVGKNFDAEMSKVAAISGASGKDFDKLRAKAREMGAKTKFSATEAGQGLEYMAMAGWKTDQMATGLEPILKLAAASGEELGTTSDIVTDSLTGFGKSADDAGTLANVMAAASSNANTNVSLMGETFKYAASVAGGYGYTMQDVALMTGLMANAGIKGSQAGTSLRSIMSRLATDAGASSKSLGALGTLTEKLGVEFYKADGSMRPLRDVINDSREAWKGLSKEEQANYAKKIAGQNAMSGWMALMQASSDDVDKLTDAIDNSDGAVDQMYDTMTNNFAGALDEMKSALQEAGITISDILTPYLKKAAVFVKNLATKFSEASPTTQKMAIVLAGIGAAIGPALVAFGKLATGLSSIIKLAPAISSGFKAVGAMIGGISLPVVAVAAVVGTLVAAFMHLWKTNEGFRTTITKSWNQIKAAFNNFASGLLARINKLGFNFKSFGALLKGIWDGFTKFLAPVFEGAFASISSILNAVLPAILGVVDFFVSAFKGDWKGMLSALKTIFSSLWTGLTKLVKIGLTTLKNMWGVVLGWFGTSWQKLWNGVKKFFSGIWAGIRGVVIKAINGLKKAVSAVWNAIKKVTTVVFKALYTITIGRTKAQINSIKNAWKAAKTWLSKTWNTIKSTASRVWTAVKNVVMRPVNAAKSMLSSAWSAIRSAASAAWTKAKSTASTVWNAIKNAIYNPIKSAKSSLSSVVGAIKSALSNAWSNIKSKASSTWNAIKNAIHKPIMAAKSKVNSVVQGIKNAMGKLSSIKGKVSGIFKSIKDKITSPISSAKDKISSVISRIKSLFSGLHLTIPKPKIPKISVSGGKAPFGIGGKGSLPSFHVSWAASGGIMNRPTLFGGGEAGPEAILPLDPFWKRLDQMADNIVSGVATVAAANAGGGGDIHLDVYLYPSGPKMMEQIVKAYDTGKRRLG